MIIAKFSRKIPHPHFRRHRERHVVPDGRLPGISLEDVSEGGPAVPPRKSADSPKNENLTGRASPGEDKERRRLRNLSPFRSSEKRRSGEWRRSGEVARSEVRTGDLRPGELCRPSDHHDPSNRASLDLVRPDPTRPDLPDRAPPRPSRPATEEAMEPAPGSHHHMTPRSPGSSNCPSPTVVKSPLMRPDSPGGPPIPELGTDFNRNFHVQNPGNVTCGFEDTFLPVDVEKLESHRLSHLYRFRHEDSLKLHQTLQKQLYNKPGDIVLEFYDVTVYKEDIDNLQPGYWLNDNNISFVYEYLERLEIYRAGFQSQIFLLRPSMAFLLGQGNPLEVAEFLPDFKHASFIFLPINDNNNVEIVSGNHWSLLVVSVEDGKAIYYDTVGECNIMAARNVADKLAVVLGQQLTFLVAPTPQQSNGSDCGVYVCEITSLLLRRLLYTEGFIDLGISNLTFVADAGRTFILTAILQLISMFGNKIRDKP